MVPNLINNLWVVIAALLVFSMTIAVGFLEVRELGRRYSRSLIKTIIITFSAIFISDIHTGYDRFQYRICPDD